MNVSQSLPFQALSNVCISRRFSSTPIPKIHLVDWRIRWPFNYYDYSSRPLSFPPCLQVHSTIDFTFPLISSLIAPTHSPLSMRLVIVKEVLWCWSCNKVKEHDVSNHPGSAGGWVTIVCRACRATQVEQVLKDGTIRDSLISP